jgi:hypothetical protein
VTVERLCKSKLKEKDTTKIHSSAMTFLRSVKGFIEPDRNMNGEIQRERERYPIKDKIKESKVCMIREYHNNITLYTVRKRDVGRPRK